VIETFSSSALPVVSPGRVRMVASCTAANSIPRAGWLCWRAPRRRSTTALEREAMNYWLLKSEPETWSWDQQASRGAKGETWDGVRNHQAAGFLRQMKKGDQAYFYHSGKARSIVGIVEVIREAFIDPTDQAGKFVAVQVRALRAMARPVSLAEIKTDPRLAELLLIRQSRLSVMPVAADHWRVIADLERGQP
jgi:predicted RNA-binding protein with PUA-like domain